jgi:hypothetical protein
MNEVIDEIVNEWSKRIPSGIIDMNNQNHLEELFRVMESYIGDTQIIQEWIDNMKRF